jgi:hypothetical protein
MEFPDTTLNSALSNHFSERLTFFLNRGDLDNDVRRRTASSMRVNDNLPINLARSLKNKLTKSQGLETFLCHSGYQTPSLLSIEDDGLTDLSSARSSLVDLLSHSSVLRKALEVSFQRKMFNGKIGKFSNQFSKFNVEPSLKLIKDYAKVMMWQRIIDTTTQAGSLGLSWNETPKAWVNKRATVMSLNGEWIVMPHDAVLMIKDIVWGNFLISLYCMFDPARSYLISNLDFFQRWGFEGLEIYGDEAYNLIKMIEPVCVTRLIQMSEKMLDPDKQYHVMLEKYRDKEMKMRCEMCLPILVEKSSMADKMARFLDKVNNPDQVSEMFSIMRMTGHPYIDPVEGSLALERLGKAPSTATFKGIKATEWSFCHMFTRGYIDKMKKWPKLHFNFPDDRKSTLKDLYETQHMPMPLGIAIYDPADWDYVTFEPIDDFDYGQDLLSLMTDKSLSYRRSEVDNSWSGRLPYNPKKPTSSNRVLEQLLRFDLDLKSVCDAFSKGEIPFDWLVVVTHPKEREMKALIARMYAIMNIEPRSFFCLLEDNLARKIYKFIPEQTMTMNSGEKEELFNDLSSEVPGRMVLSIGIDLSKWCSHFRHRTVINIGRRLDQLLGVNNLYGSVHEFFKKSLIIVRHPAYTPTQDTKDKKGNLKEEPGIYTEVESGLEGTNQKLWTLITLCDLHWASWRFGFTYKITCQGDNLVIYIYLYKDKAKETEESFKQRIQRINDKVLESISSAANEIGHEVNPDECFSSTSYMTYGKDMWFKGKKLESLSKVITRMFPKTTSDTPSFESILANIAATGTSLVERANDILPVFLFTKAMEFLVIDRETKFSMVHKDKIGLTGESSIWRFKEYGGRFLCNLVPSNLGGFPVSSFAEFLYRGHSDPLSSSLGSLELFDSIPPIRKFLSCIERDTFVGLSAEALESEEARLRSQFRLLRDPFSIPINKPQGAIMSTVENVKSTLRHITKNKALVPIVKISTDREEEEKLMRSLLKSFPLNPKILNELMESSIFGVGNSIARRFTNTRTLRRITSSGEINLVSSHINNDFHYVKGTFNFLRRVLEVRGGIVRTMKSYQLLSFLRKRWMLGELDGVTNYHPLCAGEIILSTLYSPIDLSEVIENESNPLIVASNLKTSYKISCDKRGDVTPYLGNLTSEKAISKWVKPIDSSPPLNDAMKLIQIAKLCTEPSSPMRNLIELLARQRTSLPLSVLYEISKEQVGGTSAHRLSTSAASRGSRSASLPNWSTHFLISSNLSRALGILDYPLSFAEHYLTIIALSKLLFNEETEAPFSLISVIDLSVLQPVQEQMITLDSTPSLKDVTVPKNSYYLYAESVTLSDRNSVGVKLPMEKLGRSTSDIVEAMSVIFMSGMTGTSGLIRKQGYRRSKMAKKPLLDLPEAGIIELTEYLEAGSLSLLMYSSRKIISRINIDEDQDKTIAKVLIEGALVLAPLIFSSINLSNNNDDDLLRLSAGEKIVERKIIHLGCILVNKSMGLMNSDLKIPPVFELTRGSMSTSIATRLQTLILLKLRSNKKNVRTCKFLSRLIVKLEEKRTEELRVSSLIQLAELVGMIDSLKLDYSSAEQTVRKVRMRELLEKIPEPHPKVEIRWTKTRSCWLTDKEIEFPDFYYKRDDLLDSWRLRPFPGVSDSHLKWSPIETRIPSGSLVYVIGIGAGGILRCIRNSCKVIGLDLPDVMSNLGQNFINYKTSVYHPGYETTSLSWTQNLENLDEKDVECIISDILRRKVDVVIIDIDRVPAMKRIGLRNKIASYGIDCWVRIHCGKEEILELCKNLDAISSDDDDWWIPEISVGYEIILGKGRRELGGLVAQGDAPETRLLRAPRRTLKDDEKIEFVMRFGGNINDKENMEDFIWSKGVVRFGTGYVSLAEAHLLIIEDFGLATKSFGRLSCRMIVFVFDFYL